MGLAVLLSACGHKAPAVPTPQQIENLPLATTALAGQTITVVPLSLLAADTLTEREPEFVDRAHALGWVDSILGAALNERAPEVIWKLPPELRKIARRAPGIAPDPDRMGQGMMRDPALKIVPDPFRASLRTLTALAGGRFALVPAVTVFYREKNGEVTAEMSLVVLDSRDAIVDWRTHAIGHGATPRAALGDLIDHVLPPLAAR